MRYSEIEIINSKLFIFSKLCELTVLILSRNNPGSLFSVTPTSQVWFPTSNLIGYLLLVSLLALTCLIVLLGSYLGPTYIIFLENFICCKILTAFTCRWFFSVNPHFWPSCELQAHKSNWLLDVKVPVWPECLIGILNAAIPKWNAFFSAL